MTIPAYLRELHSSLDARLRPEDVLTLISKGCPDAVPYRVRGTSLSIPSWMWSSMSSDFERPVGGGSQLASVVRAFQHPLGKVDADDSRQLASVANSLGEELGGNGRRLTREERERAAVGLSRRKYNRQWRAMRRLHHKAQKLSVEQRKRELLLIGRSGFASRITLDRFAADPHAAHFLSYWVARRNLRRQFSLAGKVNPMDDVAAHLLKRCVEHGADWAMIALIRPTPDVLSRLEDEEKGRLLAKWYAVMREAAEILKDVWPDGVNRARMTVQRGHDSSTWNTIAQAYNTSRASWLSCVTALGAESLLDAACPGKVMRLMAADLVYWHSATGGDVDPNTKVWSELPLPWAVLDGSVRCTRADVARVCERAGIDPQDSGWIAPRPEGVVVPFEVTPELVHGVTVADPTWALFLRRAGVFSGKRLTADEDLREAAGHGLAGGVVTSALPERVGWFDPTSS